MKCPSCKNRVLEKVKSASGEVKGFLCPNASTFTTGDFDANSASSVGCDILLSVDELDDLEEEERLRKKEDLVLSMSQQNLGEQNSIPPDIKKGCF